MSSSNPTSGSNSSVLVVLSNYLRPSHLPACISAWKCQSVPPASIIVVDNSPRPVDEDLPERYPNPLFEGADDVWRFRHNLGCPARSAPALCLYNHLYTIFADDDLIPGNKAIETLLSSARGPTIQGKFSSIGQIGRIVDPARPSGQRYVQGNAFRACVGNHPLPPSIVDITCRCYMVHTYHLHHMVSFRSLLYSRIAYTSHTSLLNIHDDMLCCFGIQCETGYQSYVIPQQADPQCNLILRNLQEPNAVWKRPSHFTERNQMVDLCLEAGWRPLR